MVGKPLICRTENAQFVVLLSHVQQIEAHKIQFFAHFYRFVVPTTQDLAIFVTTTTTDRRQTTDKLIALPHTHACGIIIAM